MMKPNEEIYYRLFEKFELVPEECFFIDDSERNISTSRKCGMEGHIFDINNFEKLTNELKKKLKIIFCILLDAIIKQKSRFIGVTFLVFLITLGTLT